MPPPDHGADRFRYDGFAVDRPRARSRAPIRRASHSFTERFTFGPDGDWDHPAACGALRILFLLAGVSYYKTTAAPVDRSGGHPDDGGRARLPRPRYYVDGLAEFAYRNGVDLSGRARGRPRPEPDPAPASAPGPRQTPLTPARGPPRPLVPFGGGIDSIVTVDAIAAEHRDTSLFVLHPPHDRFAAIEGAAAVTGLPVTRVEREIDPQVRRSAELGFLNGHVPVTAIVTAAALVDGRARRSRRRGPLQRVVGIGADRGHRRARREPPVVQVGGVRGRVRRPGARRASGRFRRCSRTCGLAPSCGWPALRRADPVPPTFRSCNRAFHQDPARRLDHWCGTCDKCCFIDLVLAPFVDATDLGADLRRATRAAGEPGERGALRRAPRRGDGRSGPSSASATPTSAAPPWSLASERPDRRSSSLAAVAAGPGRR